MMSLRVEPLSATGGDNGVWLRLIGALLSVFINDAMLDVLDGIAGLSLVPDSMSITSYDLQAVAVR
jgi:hypothetical protein